jgi:DNA-binding transcriptional ArsR family regulator
MDLSNPISSIIPSGHGTVLAVLARTDRPLTGRKVAELTGGRVSQSRVSEVLRELTRGGIVLCDEHPPAKLYRLNREHVAADAVVELARQRERLVGRLRDRLGMWSPPPAAAWLFGSFARGEGDMHSDLDVLIVRPDAVNGDDPEWSAQVDDFIAQVARWSGNQCSLLEYSEQEFADLVRGGERLADELRRDGLHLAGPGAATRLKAKAR